MKVWKQRQAGKGYLTWQEYMEAGEEDKMKILEIPLAPELLAILAPPKAETGA